MTVVDPALWPVVSALFDDALALPAPARDAWLEALHAARPEIAPQVAALLEAHEASSSAGFMAGGHIPPNLLDGSLKGQVLGAYVLESLIGQGGMGSVWLARRSDGRFVGAVAIKLLNASLIGQKGGERFRREVQILARLAHPHIAHLTDAGLTPAGQPYLVMEYVRGETIDRHCDSHRLDVARRIRLFLEVLGAVAHAHANLIVHRDIKPANVLVDDEGGAKLLDFGIAKLLEDDVLSGDAAAFTQEDGRALTPDHAAPEQLLGQPITIATDVYALGVLLYQLLTGLHPAGDGQRSIAELVKSTVELEAPRMSDAVASTSGDAFASTRGTTPKRLSQALHGDLDTIVAKALRKNPNERYATVDAFADDLRRHLDQRPVSARPDTPTYRINRFVARNRAATAAGSLALIAVVAGLAGTITQSHRATAQAVRAGQFAEQARHQRDRAVRQLTFAEATDEFLGFLLQQGSDKPYTTAQLLARGEQLVDQQFADDPVLRARMQLTLANLYSEAMEQTKAESLYLRAQASAAGVADASLQASVECGLAERYGDQNAFDKAAQLFDRAIARLEAEPDQDTGQLAICLNSRSMVDTVRGDPRAAVADAQAALRYLGTPRPGQRSSAILARQALADAQASLGQTRSAIDEYQKTLDELTRMGRAHTMQAISAFNSLGVLLSRSGQWQRAVAIYQQGLAVAGENERAESALPSLETNYAKLLVELGRTDEAKTRFEAAMAAATQRGHVRSLGSASLIAATAWCASGDLVRCDALLHSAREQLQANLPAGHATLGTLDTEEAQLALARGQPDVARDHLVHALAIFAAAPDRNPNRLRAAALLATANLRLGERDAALAQSIEAVRQARDALGGFESSAWLGEALLVQGNVQDAVGDHTSALASWQSALGQLHATLGDDAPATREIARLLKP